MRLLNEIVTETEVLAALKTMGGRRRADRNAVREMWERTRAGTTAYPLTRIRLAYLAAGLRGVTFTEFCQSRGLSAEDIRDAERATADRGISRPERPPQEEQEPCQ